MKPVFIDSNIPMYVAGRSFDAGFDRIPGIARVKLA